MAIYFCIFLDQIRPKWIKLANSVNRHLEFSNSSPKGLISILHNLHTAGKMINTFEMSI